MDATLLILFLFTSLGIAAGFLSRRFFMSGKLALSFAFMPLAGVALSTLFSFCWGHPLQMLGPGIVMASTPFAFGYAWYARALAPDRAFAYVALGLSSLELLGFLLLVGSLFLEAL